MGILSLVRGLTCPRSHGWPIWPIHDPIHTHIWPIRDPCDSYMTHGWPTWPMYDPYLTHMTNAWPIITWLIVDPCMTRMTYLWPYDPYDPWLTHVWHIHDPYELCMTHGWSYMGHLGHMWVNHRSCMDLKLVLIGVTECPSYGPLEYLTIIISTIRHCPIGSLSCKSKLP